MNRRGFLGLLGAAVTGAVLDPEKLLWRPGAKVISIPKVEIPEIALSPISFDVGDVITIEGWYKLNPLTRATTSELQQFVVTRPSPAGRELKSLFPSVIERGPYANVAKRPMRGSRRVMPISMSPITLSKVSRFELL